MLSRLLYAFDAESKRLSLLLSCLTEQCSLSSRIEAEGCEQALQLLQRSKSTLRRRQIDILAEIDLFHVIGRLVLSAFLDFDSFGVCLAILDVVQSRLDDVDELTFVGDEMLCSRERLYSVADHHVLVELCPTVSFELLPVDLILDFCLGDDIDNLALLVVLDVRTIGRLIGCEVTTVNVSRCSRNLLVQRYRWS